MSGVVWKNRDIENLRTTINVRLDLIRARGEELMQGIVDEAAAQMRHIIEIETTPTGDRRAAANRGVAGRIESEDMIGDVLSHVEIGENGKLITGSFGWLEEWEEYYLLQEGGTGKIKAMHALLTSFIVAREKLRAELKALAGSDFKL